MFLFLHRLIVSFHNTSIYRQEPWVFILCSVPVAASSWITKKHVSAKHLTVLLKKKLFYISDGLGVSKYTTNLTFQHFCVNHPFKDMCYLDFTSTVLLTHGKKKSKSLLLIWFINRTCMTEARCVRQNPIHRHITILFQMILNRFTKKYTWHFKWIDNTSGHWKA